MNVDTDLRPSITGEFAFDWPLASVRRKAGKLLNWRGLLRHLDGSNPDPPPPLAGADVFCRKSARRGAISVLNCRAGFDVETHARATRRDRPNSKHRR